MARFLALVSLCLVLRVAKSQVPSATPSPSSTCAALYTRCAGDSFHPGTPSLTCCTPGTVCLAQEGWPWGRFCVYPSPSPTPSSTPKKIPDATYLATLETERRRNSRMSLPGGGRSALFYWFDKFDSFNSSRWFTAGYWWNGVPFGSGFQPNYYSIASNTLSVYADSSKFPVNDEIGTVLNYTSTEIRSKEYFGFGCYSVCMKASPISGVSSSFYAYAGMYDDPDNHGPQGSPPGQGKCMYTSKALLNIVAFLDCLVKSRY
jgi:hypothetical protein